MSANDAVEESYKALGEFVIVFQWVENVYRQMGWFIINPERTEWPPMELRKETNYALINKVTKMFIDLTTRYSLPGGAEKAKEMQELRDTFHELRKYRNCLLHSAFVELKAGDDIHGYLRSNPDVGVDPESGELIYDQEEFTADLIYSKLREYGDSMFRLNVNYVQILHWYPFSRHGTGI